MPPFRKASRAGRPDATHRGVVRRLAELYRLLGPAARAQLLATAFLLVLERLVFAAGAIGITHRLIFVWGATAAVGAVWILRSLFRQRVTSAVREKITMAIAEAALESGANGTLLPGEEAEAAVFEGRYAAEQTMVRHLPSLFAEPVAALVLLVIVKPTGVPVLAVVVALAGSALALGLLRKLTSARQRVAWRNHMTVAQGTLTSIRAATEIVASGKEAGYLANLRIAVGDWTRAAMRAERSAALVQRIPLAAVIVLGAIVVVKTAPLRIDHAIRLGIFFPPLAGLVRSALELVRLAPKILALAPVLDALYPRPAAETRSPADDLVSSVPSAARANSPPPKLPCEIRFERVSFGYSGALVLENVSFVWKPGDIFGIRGPNGSGKSTLLRLLLGLVEPSGGRILVGGFDLRDLDLPAWRRCVSYLPQRSYLPEKATVFEAMQLTMPDLTTAEAQVALTRTGAWERLRQSSDGVTKPLHMRMSSLSVGMRQRVLLSRIFARATTVLLLDEPDENLDSDTCTLLMQLLRNLGPSHMVAIATHDIGMLATARGVVELGVPLAFTRAMP
jgi:ABC-type bacteriocin/lantibiotic exporter with double-glycine peptidase domain